MSRAAARISPQPEARVRSGKRLRVTLGDLVAAAYDALGPEASAADVARLLRHPELAEGLRPRVELG